MEDKYNLLIDLYNELQTIISLVDVLQAAATSEDVAEPASLQEVALVVYLKLRELSGSLDAQIRTAEAEVLKDQ